MTQVNLSIEFMGRLFYVNFPMPDDVLLDPEFNLENFIRDNLDIACNALLNEIKDYEEKEEQKILYGDGSTPPPMGILKSGLPLTDYKKGK